jgi:hypothetical protein
METDEMPDICFTTEKMKNKIRKLRTAAAAGPDGIGPRVLQELAEVVAEGLSMVFQKPYDSGIVPTDWKDANVTPIFEKRPKCEPGNYRPISLTSVCCKLMEQIIRDGIMNQLISPSQHVFMLRKSCCSNLLEFLARVNSAVGGGKPFDEVFLDFTKAFDKVPRERLLEKLRAHGIRGQALNWIRQWLTG